MELKHILILQNKIDLKCGLVPIQGLENESDCIYIESMTNLFEIIEKVNRNETDLNFLIENINKISIQEWKKNFEKKIGPLLYLGES